MAKKRPSSSSHPEPEEAVLAPDPTDHGTVQLPPAPAPRAPEQRVEPAARKPDGTVPPAQALPEKDAPNDPPAKTTTASTTFPLPSSVLNALDAAEKDLDKPGAAVTAANRKFPAEPAKVATAESKTRPAIPLHAAAQSRQPENKREDLEQKNPALPKPQPASSVEAQEKGKGPVPLTTRQPPSEHFLISEARLLSELPTIEPAAEAESEVEPPPAPPPTPALPSMFVMMIASELAPVAKVGGLGDVVYGLARELEMRGNATEVILPKYNNMRYDHIWGLTKTYENLWVPWYGGAINTSVWFGYVHGRKCFFIEPHSNDNFFNRGVYYGHNDDLMRFAFFCRAVLEFMLKTGKHPDVIHCHDWQTALVPVLLYEMYQHLGMRHPRVCFTIHNFRHQGVTGGHLLQATGLHRPEYFFHYDRMRDNHNPHAINIMKAGIVYSNFVTTVSPRHAWEAKDGGQAHGLEPTLHTHHYKYGGVLNGLDYDQFNPETDPHVPAHFSVRNIEKKYENKRALRNRFWLADNEKPVIAFIGRLDAQKGLELVRHSIFYALNNRAQFVLLGNSPERGINDHFLGLKHHLNDSPDCHLEIGYNEELARLIYAGADMMIVPSRYEPCGLTQMISLRYGTVPVVRSVGGLADTVFDKDYSNRPLHERNGYVFDHADNAGIESALSRALGCYYHFPEHWRQLMINGMKTDYSWNIPGQHYLNIYDYIRDK